MYRLTGLGPFAGRASPLPPISAPLPSPGSGEFSGQPKLLTPTGLMDQVRRGRASATTSTSSEPGTPATTPGTASRPSPAQLTRCEDPKMNDRFVVRMTFAYVITQCPQPMLAIAGGGKSL